MSVPFTRVALDKQETAIFQPTNVYCCLLLLFLARMNNSLGIFTQESAKQGQGSCSHAHLLAPRCVCVCLYPCLCVLEWGKREAEFSTVAHFLPQRCPVENCFDSPAGWPTRRPASPPVECLMSFPHATISCSLGPVHRFTCQRLLHPELGQEMENSQLPRAPFLAARPHARVTLN